jgi:hypothetical protein
MASGNAPHDETLVESFTGRYRFQSGYGSFIMITGSCGHVRSRIKYELTPFVRDHVSQAELSYSFHRNGPQHIF